MGGPNPRVPFALVVASFLSVCVAGSAQARQTDTRIMAGLAVSSAYPDRFDATCSSTIAAAPSLRAQHSIHRFLALELGVSGLFRFPGVHSACGDAVPLMDGEVYRRFDGPRGGLSVAGEVRAVVTPLRADERVLRLIGGAAWYPTRSAPAWIVGVGLRPALAAGRLTFDLERWAVGVAYDLEQYRAGAPGVPLGGGREWQGMWQLRMGLDLWSR